MKKQTITETDKPAFFKLLNRAARPQSQPAAKTLVHPNADDCGDRKIRSNTSVNVAKKHGGKSH